MQTTDETSGYRKIFQDLVLRLAHVDIAAAADKLGLGLTEAGEAEIPFLGRTYLVSTAGVRRADRAKFYESTGSVLCHYIMNAGRHRPSGRMVTFAALAGPLFKKGSYSQGALEHPLIRRFQGRVDELLAAVTAMGGRVAGEAGIGSVSLMVDLLPNIPLQVIFYDRDEEFAARATLLYDENATRFLEFEFFAVLVTIFVRGLAAFRPRPIVPV
ncbi:MAG: DUF3786 domain-containing protein [Desulfatitalea sp.]